MNKRDFADLIQGLPQSSRSIRRVLLEQHGIKTKSGFNRDLIARQILSDARTESEALAVLCDLILNSESSRTIECLRELAEGIRPEPRENDADFLWNLWKSSLRKQLLVLFRESEQPSSLSGAIQAGRHPTGKLPEEMENSGSIIAESQRTSTLASESYRQHTARPGSDQSPYQQEWMAFCRKDRMLRWFESCGLAQDGLNALMAKLELEQNIRDARHAAMTIFGKVPVAVFKREILSTLREVARYEPVDLRRYLSTFFEVNGSLLQFEQMVEESPVPEQHSNAYQEHMRKMKYNFDVASSRLREIKEDQVKTSHVVSLLAILGWPTESIVRVTAEARVRTRGEADFIVSHPVQPLVIEVKRPSKTLGRDEWQQTYAYASHSSVRAPWFILMNGIQLEVHDTRIRNHSTPVFKMDAASSGWKLSDIDIRHLHMLSRPSMDQTVLARSLDQSIGVFFRA